MGLIDHHACDVGGKKRLLNIGVLEYLGRQMLASPDVGQLLMLFLSGLQRVETRRGNALVLQPGDLIEFEREV